MARYPGLGHPAWRQAVWRWWVLHVIQPVYLWWVFRETGTAWLVWLHNSLYAALFNLLVREARPRSKRLKGKPPDWEDPTVFARNTLAPHTPLHSFESTHAALEFWRQRPKDRAANSNVQLLSGQWKFHLAPNPDTVPLGFECHDYDDEDWGTIAVPSNWQCEGFGTPIYTNKRYPFPMDPPIARRDAAFVNGRWDFSQSPEDSNPTGCYRTTFSVPVEWVEGGAQGGQVRLAFGGVDSCLICWLNGHRLGYSQDSRLPAEFDVTSVLQSSENVLTVQVMQFCDGSYLEDQDHWWLSGIYRDVTLQYKPPSRIVDYTVHTTLHPADGHDDDFEAVAMLKRKYAEQEQRRLAVRLAVAGVAADVAKEHGDSVVQDVSTVKERKATRPQQRASKRSVDSTPSMKSTIVSESESYMNNVLGRVEIEAMVEHHGQGNQFRGELRLELMSLMADNPELLAVTTQPVLTQRGETATVTLTVEINHPELWSAEKPTLYLAALALVSEDGNVLDCEACRVGMREVGIIDGQLCVNKTPLMVAGVNRHEHCPAHGKVVTEEGMLQDIRLLKQHNFNAVRCSHYPNTTRWYELCDEYGLFVVDEANLEAHGFESQHLPVPFLANRPEWQAAHVHRMRCMVERDKNFPCIIMWSLGNENGVGRAHEAMVAWTRERDPSRPIHYEPSGGRSAVTDVICPMYARVATIRKWAEDSSDPRPIILCEYQHAMNNSTGGLDEYWSAFRSHKRLQGGFIWDWVDQGLHMKSADGKAGWGYGGDFGDMPNDGPFCINGLVFPDRMPHPALDEVKFLQQPIGMELTNVGSNACPELRLEIKNRFSVTSVGTFEGKHRGEHLSMIFHWRIMTDKMTPDSGEQSRLAAGVLVMPEDGLRPGDMLRADWTEHFPPMCDLMAALPVAGEMWLHIEVQLRHEASWAPAGHCVARGCFAVPIPAELRIPRPVLLISEMNHLRLTENLMLKGSSVVGVHGSNGLFVAVARDGSGLAALQTSGIDLVQAGPAPCLWRAPTDNDKGGLYPGANFASWWRTAGLDTLRPTEDGVKVTVHHVAPCMVRVNSTWRLEGDMAGGGGGLGVSVESAVEVYGSGDVVVSFQIECDPLLPFLPRVGVRMRLNGGLQDVAWLGSKAETYPDRKAAAVIGCHRSTVAAMHTPYVVPAECGGRTDTRWVALSAPADRNGLLIMPAGDAMPMQMSVSNYSMEALERAQHEHELEADGAVHLHMDAEHAGLGGDDSWTPAVLPRHRVAPRRHAIALRLRPLTPQVGNDIDAAYRAAPPPYSDVMK